MPLLHFPFILFNHATMAWHMLALVTQSAACFLYSITLYAHLSTTPLAELRLLGSHCVFRVRHKNIYLSSPCPSVIVLSLSGTRFGSWDSGAEAA